MNFYANKNEQEKQEIRSNFYQKKTLKSISEFMFN